MVPSVILITKTAVDFPTFLALSQQALGYSPSADVDASPLERSDTERFLACLAAMKKQEVSPSLLTHASISVLVAADDRDMLDILSYGMPFVVTDTQMRGVQLAVITGNLSQWRDAVKSGATKGTQFNVRAFCNRVMSLFQEAGTDIWKDFDTHTLPDSTLYLTYKR